MRVLKTILFSCLAVFAGHAMAQDMSGTPAPPDRPMAIDENGVDLYSGQLILRTTDLVLGDGPSRLNYERWWGGKGWRDNFTLTAHTTISNWKTISIGGDSEVFHWEVDTSTGVYRWVPSRNEGGTLTQVSGGGLITLTYTRRDGTVVTFSNTNADSDQASGGRASEIVYPNGEKITFYYKTATYSGGFSKVSRLQSAVSNFGWQIKLSYARNDSSNLGDSTNRSNWRRVTKAQAINNSVEACNPSADSCTLVNPWPATTYSETTSSTDRVLTVTDPIGRQWKYRTGSTGTLKGIRYPGGASDTIAIQHDPPAAGGRVQRVTRGGQEWDYIWYNDFDLGITQLTRIDPLNNQLVVDNERTITDELGRVTTLQYDQYARVTRRTFPEGNAVAVTYDDRSNVTESRLIAKAGSGLADIVTTANYDATCTNPKTCNKPNSVTDARGNVTDYTYDPTHGGVLTVTRPIPIVGAVRPQTRYSYSQVNGVWLQTGTSECQTGTAPACVGTTDEVKTSLTYSGSNTLLASSSAGDGTGALSATTTMTYDNVGNMLTEDGPLPGTADTTRHRYDAAGQLIGTVSPDPDGAGALKHRAQRFTYAPHGPLAKTEYGAVNSQSDADWAAFAPLEAVETTFDPHFRPATQRLLAGNGTIHAVTQTSYDLLSRPECSAVRMNTALYGSLPASACTLGTQGSFGPDRISKTIYDAAGQVTQLQVAVSTADSANERTLTYTSNGKLQTLKDAENNLTTYEYDGHDRLAKTRFPLPTQGSNASSTTDYEQLSYDAASNVTNRRLRDAQNIAFTYDNLNRPTLKNLPGSEPDVTYGYDNLGRLTSANQAGNSLSFSYDALSRNLTQVGPQGTVSSQWDIAGRRTRLTYPGAGLFVDYDYLVTGEMTRIRENGATSGVGVLATFGYDDLGRRTSLTFGNGVSQAYGYDPVSRLASLTNELIGTTNDLSITFAYNPASQIASTTRTGDNYAWTGHGSESTASIANGLNQLTSIGGSATARDARGNLTSDPTSGKTFGYSYENLLTSSSGGTSATLSYDPQMRLYQLTAGASITRFIYSDDEVIAEYDGANALKRRFVFGPGVDEPLVWYEGSGTSGRRFLSSDERGSIISLTDTSGAPIAINRYDEYGKLQAGNLGRFQYTGQLWLGEIGLYHYKARAYAPHLGRFLQTDPIGYEDNVNLYAYVGNDPINLSDPTGFGPEFSDETIKDQSGDFGDEIVVIGRRIAETITQTVDYSWAIAEYGAQTGLYGLRLAPYSLSRIGHRIGVIPQPLARPKLPQVPKWGCGCLEAGTLVATPDGMVPIETIEVGDAVLAVDEKTGQIEAKAVADLIRPEPKPLYRLELRDAGGKAEVFHATDDHPWKANDRGWVETRHLKLGDEINSGSGANLVVTSLTLTSRVEPTYNLEVADFHTFMVGNDRAVVHNACKRFNPNFLPPRLRQAFNDALAKLNSGARGQPYRNDNGLLPQGVSYSKISVETPGNDVRIIQGSDGSRYITFDHYESFSRIR